MHTALKRTGLVLAGAAVLTLGIDYAAMAATGKSLILGKTNKAGATTTIQNTKSGAALSLKTKSNATAPLKVNGKGKVVNLNSDKLDGLDSTQLQRKVASCGTGKAISGVSASGAASCGTLPRAAIWTLGTNYTGGSLDLYTGGYPAGTYLVTANTMADGTSNTDRDLSCRLYTANPNDTGGTTRVAGNSGQSSDDYIASSISTAVTTNTARSFNLFCTTLGTGNLTFDATRTTISVVQLDGGSAATLD